MSIAFSPTPPALRVEIKPSLHFGVALAGATLAALAAIFYADLTWLPRLLLVLVALIYGGYCWRAQRRQRGVLQWRSVWSWCGADGVERALHLRHSTVWPGLIVLTFHDIERKQSWVLTLLADSFDCDESARRLRVHLNHFAVFAGDDGAG